MRPRSARLTALGEVEGQLAAELERVGHQVAVVEQIAAHSSSPTSARSTTPRGGRQVELGEALERVGIVRRRPADGQSPAAAVGARSAPVMGSFTGP
jgi:hypothetical protein